MQRLSTIEIYNRKWSNMSLLYRIEQLSKHANNAVTAQVTFPLRRRSDYFYIEQPKGNRFVFLPDSRYRECWELLSIFLIIYQQLSISYSLSFTTSIPEVHFNLLIFCDVFFAVEIFCNLNTGYFSEGTLVKHRQKIIKKYLKGRFFADFFACFPFEFFYKHLEFDSTYDPDMSIQDYLKLLWLFKAFNLFKLPDIIHNFQCKFTSELVYTIFHLVKFLVSAVLLIHWTACLMYFFFLKDLENNGLRWNFIYDSGANPYLKYFYMIVYTMTSTGYGDITPYSINQKMLAIGIMGLSCWLFAFILTNSKDILLKYTSVEGYYKEVIFKLKKFMKSKKINRRLRLRTISYLQFMKANFKKKNLKEQEILDLLSPTLREDIIIKTRGKLIQKCIVFKNYSMDFIRAVIRHLKHSIFAPNDLIIKEGDRTNSIFFILNGKVEIYHEKTKTVFVELGKKKYFGEIAFFLERVRTSSARSLVFSEILYLEKKDLEVTLRSRPKEVENHRIFITMAQNNLKVIGIKCYLCGTHGHLARDCKKFVILVNKAEIVKNADNKRYKLNKKVGDLELEEPVVVLRSRYSRRNSVGFPNNLNSFNENKRLRKMCKDYLNQSKKVNYKYKIKKEHFDESSSSDGENDLIRTSSVLPKNLQYSSLYFTRKSLLIDNSPESLKISNQSETNTFTFGK